MDRFLVFNVTKMSAIDEQGTILTEVSLGPSIEEVILVYDRLRKGVKDPLVADFFKNLEVMGVTRLFVESQILADELSRLYDFRVQHYEDVRLWRRIRQEFGGSVSAVKERAQLHEIMVGVVRLAIREASEQSDQLVIQAMSSLDDVEKVQNLMVSRLREWYGLHYPEAAHAIENPNTLATLIVEGGSREIIEQTPELLKLLSETSLNPASLSHSIGGEIPPQDMIMIQALAHRILSLHQFREQLEKYLDESMLALAPNLRGLIGPVIGARLIELAGSLEKLARLPSSTIQVLGAEQAMFRALKTGAKPPKHGVIFQNTLVHSAPWWQRGKIARILAGKIAIAARVDMYSGEYIADVQKQYVLKRIAEVKQKYPSPPKAPVTKPSKRLSRKKRYGKRGKSHPPKKSHSKTRRKQ